MTSAARPALPGEHAAAFELLFGRLSAGERAYRVEQALALLGRGELDPDGVLVLPPPGPAGVLLCQPVPGAGAILWPPVVAEGPDRARREDGLLARACEWLRGRGARLAQCLLADGEMGLAGPLFRGGFRHVTGLSYLRRDLGPDQPPEERLPCRLEPYDPEDPRPFHAALARTYLDTLDCPEVNGVRTVEEVIQGHRAQGRFDPSRWWLARRGPEAVGVLLLVELAEAEWEVAYVGVAPEARGQGVGRGLLLHGLAQARAAGAGRVSLSVDDRNVPARRLYDRLGFEPYDHRQVLLAVWRPAVGA